MSADPLTDTEYPRRAVVVDLGSNSVKMVCYSADHTGAYRPYHRESAKVRLDEYDDGIIRQGPADQLVDMLKHFHNIIQYEEVGRVLAVATSAVRRAANRAPLLARIRDETGFAFEVLSGDEEALCSYAGAATHLDIPTCIFFDIGGGSLEIVSSRNHAVTRVLSLPLGALVATRRFAGYSDFDGDSIRRLRAHVRESLPPPESLGSLGRDTVLVGVGGTVRAIARYAQSYESYPLRKLHNYVMAGRLLRDVAIDILSRGRPILAQMYEIGAGRADIIKAGAVIVSEIMDWCGLDALRVCSTGLREGVLAFAGRYPEIGLHGISAYHVRELVRAPSWAPRMPSSEAGVVRTMSSSGLLSGEEHTILRAAAANLEWLRTFRDADDFLYRMLDGTSALSHRAQLLSTLCLAYAKKPKRTRLLMRRYNPLLRPGDLRLIKRISPLLLLCDMAIISGAGLHLEAGNGRLLLRVDRNERILPGAIFRQRCRSVGEALGVAIECNC